ncbi:MAG: prepilin-type N-terminal cleavage/methylation domain-containing protein [Coriobacteriia bacterium]|nr:prepilin-type N-terminal cleavage/methylation domain-containing protein [Coriobacteriia bacterium]MCL2749662.1 prepilin-type N-terminal cleavage/methylation domain-containing protein [Coriobacteriia bacterium]
MKVKNNAGMSLVEVMVAITLLVVVAVPLLGVFSYAQKMEKRAAIHTLSTYTAQMKMEEAYGLDAAQLLIAYNDSGATLPGFDDTIVLFYEFTAVPYTPGDPAIDDANYFKVTITVGNEYYEVSSTIENILQASG